jgi:hypothetical protein
MSVTTSEVQAGGPAPNPPLATMQKPLRKPFGEDGFTFADFIDIINPLQHLPVISGIYRRLTGDTIDQAPKMLGDVLFGGPLGFLGYVVGNALEDITGKDTGEHIASLILGPKETEADTAPTKTMVAEASRFEPAAGDAAPPVQVASASLADQDNDRDQEEVNLCTAARDESARRATKWRQENVALSSGGLANEGGWFSDVMLSGLTRYQEASRQQKAQAVPGMAYDAVH